MTKDEAIEEIIELEAAYPAPPYTPAERAREGETAARLAALYNYVFGVRPAPAAGWAPSAPGPDAAERARLAEHWAAAAAAEGAESAEAEAEE